MVLRNENGNTSKIHSGSSRCFIIAADSLYVDSAVVTLFGLKADAQGNFFSTAFWRIRSIDTVRQSIEFINCGKDSAITVLHKKQIQYLIPSGKVSNHDFLDVFILPSFLIGTVGTAWGLISLPFPSTPVEDDLKLIRNGVIGLGVFGAALWISEKTNDDSVMTKYYIESLH